MFARRMSLLATGLSGLALAILLIAAAPPAGAAGRLTPFMAPAVGSPLRVGQAISPTWTTDRVDNGEGLGGMTDHSAAFDKLGQLHVAYAGDHIYHGWLVGSTWHLEIVDPRGLGGGNVGLALDTQDNPVIAYNDGSLKYARRVSGQWQIQTVAANIGSYSYVSLALDSSDRPHIGYVDAGSGQVRSAAYDGANWHLTTVDGAGAGNGLSVAVDSAGNAHMAYNPNYNNLRYASWTGSAWVTQTVASGLGVGEYVSLVIDKQDHAHLSYLDNGAQILKYAHWTGSSWSIQSVDNSVGWASVLASITLNSADQPRIAYTNTNSGDLTYARWTGSAWVTDTVDSSERIGYKSLAIDANDTPHIVYPVTGGIRYAHLVNSSWSFQPVASGQSDGRFAALALAAGAPYTPSLSYASGNSLRVATFSGTGWLTSTVEAGSLVVGGGTSIALAPAFPYTAHVAYYDFNTHVLKHAARNGAGWTTETIAPIGSGSGGFGLSQGVSIALEPVAPYRPRIAYIANGNLAFAQWTGSSWLTETVAFASSAMFTLASPTLRLAPTAPYTPSISYDDMNSGQAKYAYWNGSSWTTQVVGFHGGGYRPVSMDLDHSGKPHVAYAAAGVVYASWNGSTWLTQTVSGDQPYNVISLAIDANDQPHLVYDSGANTTYAYFDGSQWSTQTLAGAGGAAVAVNGLGQPRVAYTAHSDMDLAWPAQSGVVPASGGSFAAYGLANFQFPAGALTDTAILTYTVAPVDNSQPNIGFFFDLQAVGAGTGQPLTIAPGHTYTIVVHYNETSLPADAIESALALYYWNGSAWQREPTSVVDMTNHTITATPNHFSRWGALLEISKLFLPLVIRS